MTNQLVKEILDVFSNDGKEYLGVESRNIVHSKGLWHKTVHLWIRNKNGDLLLQKRAPDKETHPDMWDISCAGHVGAGDSTKNAAVRECAEELGLEIDPEDLLRIEQLFRTYLNEDNSLIDNEITDVFILDRTVELSEITPDGSEVTAVKFISVKEFEARCFYEREVFVPHDQEYQLLFSYLRAKYLKNNQI